MQHRLKLSQITTGRIDYNLNAYCACCDAVSSKNLTRCPICHRIMRHHARNRARKRNQEWSVRCLLYCCEPHLLQNRTPGCSPAPHLVQNCPALGGVCVGLTVCWIGVGLLYGLPDDLFLISKNSVAKNSAAKIAVNAPNRVSMVVSVVDVVLVKVVVVIIGGGVSVIVAKLVCVTVA